MNKHNFKKFIPQAKHNAAPERMDVGQVIERVDLSYGYRCSLKHSMTKAVAVGMEFSMCETEKSFTIRRDK